MTKQHASKMSEVEWVAILAKVQFGSALFPAKREKPEPVEALKLSEKEWEAALERINMGRN